MNPSIFKAYDIRGAYPDEIDEASAYQIAAAFAKYTKAKNIIVGEDARPSSPKLREAVCAALQNTGANVISTGVCTTPLFYFATASSNKAEAGIMITASHNPGKYNGLKLVGKKAMPIEPKVLNAEFRMQNAELKTKKSKKITKINPVDAYIKKLLSLVDVKKIKPMKIVIDAGNGTAGITVEKILKKLPQINAQKLFFDIDMSFPNHEANPMKAENLAALRAAVIKNKADLGIAYDGDADRIGFVDEKGNAVGADLIYAAILPNLLKPKNRKTTVLYDLRCSKIVPETIVALGGKPKMTRVGHAFIKKDLKKYKALAAAELSAHYYFRDFYGVDCADLVLLYLLLELGRQNMPASRIIASFQKYFHSNEINFEVRNKDTAIARIEKKYSRQAQKISRLDGVRMEFSDGRDWWWFNVRASNTEPLLRLNIEASNKRLLDKKLRELKKLINS